MPRKTPPGTTNRPTLFWPTVIVGAALGFIIALAILSGEARSAPLWPPVTPDQKGEPASRPEPKDPKPGRCDPPEPRP